VIRACAAALLVAVASMACAYAQANAPARILFVGNSLTSTTDIPGRLAKLAGAMGKVVSVEAVAHDDYSLRDHWVDARAATAIAKGWDVVVLQQGPSAQPAAREDLLDYAKRFAVAIRAAGARPALYMVWPAADRPRDFPGAIESYRLAARGVDGILLPVGEAWLRVLSKDRRARLYADAIHPSSLGSDLAVLTIYLSLFPAGPTEFDEAYVAKISKVLEIEDARRDAWFDAATRAIDEPMALK
jgi:hypothetical protein